MCISYLGKYQDYGDILEHFYLSIHYEMLVKCKEQLKDSKCVKTAKMEKVFCMPDNIFPILAGGKTKQNTQHTLNKDKIKSAKTNIYNKKNTQVMCWLVCF